MIGVLEKLSFMPSRHTVKNPLQLSQRETQILDVLSKGRTNIQIGQELGISYKTVKNHMIRIFGKLGADNRTQAVVIAMREGLIT